MYSLKVFSRLLRKLFQSGIQLHRDFRKPLIVMSPKNLLRHKDCKSHLSEFDDVLGHPGFDKQGTRFKRLIKDRNDHKEIEEGIDRLILCSGKVMVLYDVSSISIWPLLLHFFYLLREVLLLLFVSCRCIMSWMKLGKIQNGTTWQFVELNSFALFLMTSFSESLKDTQVRASHCYLAEHVNLVVLHVCVNK